MSSTSKTNLAESALQARIRDKLNGENVKLWVEPFYDDSLKTVNDTEILALASRYSTELEQEESEVVDCILTLQRNALDRLAERDLFKETGMATIRLKLSGFPDSKDTANKERIQVNLAHMTGRDLKKQIAEIIPCSENLLKLICHGRVVDENKMLEGQNIKNGSQIMVLLLPVEHGAFRESEDNLRQLEETKDSANYLAGHSNLGAQYSLTVADQSGKPLDLPEEERKNLACALALHEKGRSALKIQEYTKALVFLLEADHSYNQCQSGLLQNVDNYGLLNLDIAWCYLSLQSIAELPAVDSRLKSCEQSLHRSYGENMERVIALKGATGSEAALFVRLHLLQGIVAYHQGHLERSKYLLQRVDEEVKRLQVSDDQLAELINLGYKTDESRLALRTTYGNVPAAVDFILRKREETEEIRKQEREDMRQKKMQRKLGNCNNGDPVSVQLWRHLKEMGFNPVLALNALKQTNNDVNAALQLVTDDMFVSQVVSTIRPREESSSAPNTDSASNATPAGPSSAITSDVMRELSQLANFLTDEVSDERLSHEEAERSQKAYDTLSKDIGSEADYIDLTLSNESEYLNRYKGLLNM